MLDPGDFNIGRALGGLAKTLEAAGKHEEALKFAEQAFKHHFEHEGPDAWWTNRKRLDLAYVLQKLGRIEYAKHLLQELQASMACFDDLDDDDRLLISDAEDLMRTIEEAL